LGFEQGQDPLAESFQQIPVPQLVFPNRRTLFSHALIRPEWLKKYKLQSCHNNVTIDRRQPKPNPAPAPHVSLALSIKSAEHNWKNCAILANFFVRVQNAFLACLVAA
jgi:hypothetical protein